MSQATAPLRPNFLTGIGVRQIRLACGLILFSYLLSHFANHALGNVSYAAMEEGLDYHLQFWRQPLVAAVFYTAAIVHWMLGLWALYQRRQFRYKGPEITQLLLGLSIPFLIVIHLVFVRLPATLFERDTYYAGVLYSFWVNRPTMHWVQFALLLVAWTHGCIGLYFWLRLKGFFRRLAPYLLAAAVLIPTLALLGLAQGAREVVALSASPEWRANNLGPGFEAAQRQTLDDIVAWSAAGYVVVLALILAARGVRTLRERSGGVIRLSYPGGRIVQVPRGWSVLEASLRHHIPHASVCGGRARCSTCRIRVVGDITALPSASPRESFVLARVGASVDPAVRLACQLRPECDIAFFPIFRPQISAGSLPAVTRVHAGEERYVVSMFVDMRRSTSVAEKRLPFDTMFLINRFVAAVSSAVEAAGGEPNQFVGDGVLALFGVSASPDLACRQALAAIEGIAANIDQLNKDLAHDLREPICYGIGVNGGEVVLGEIGYGTRNVFTALGDAVNVAARLQDMAKEFGCEVVLSEDVCQRSGVGAATLSSREVTIRGRNAPLRVRTAAAARILTGSGDRISESPAE
ncbi:MAG TPA: adenylate/guanylate cyclase domain-containing protein [Casimicrobiaceae bacterium]|nr:adenylate/guanylate cyclase domain-containing protein [Casimicrobiaceae bacterium]